MYEDVSNKISSKNLDILWGQYWVKASKLLHFISMLQNIYTCFTLSQSGTIPDTLLAEVINLNTNSPCPFHELVVNTCLVSLLQFLCCFAFTNNRPPLLCVSLLLYLFDQTINPLSNCYNFNNSDCTVMIANSQSLHLGP